MSSNEPVGGESRTSEVNLAEEVREFGRQLSAVIRAVRESPRAREIEQQVTQAMREVDRQVSDALGTTREKVQPQQMKETLKGAAATAAEEAQRGLARGLHALNERMEKAVQEAERTRTTSNVAGSGGAADTEPAAAGDASASGTAYGGETGQATVEDSASTNVFGGTGEYTQDDTTQPRTPVTGASGYGGESEASTAPQTQAGPVFQDDPDSGNKEPGDREAETFPTAGFVGPAGTPDNPTS